MSLLILSAKALGTLIGYGVSGETIRRAKNAIKNLLIDADDEGQFDKALFYLETCDFHSGIKEIEDHAKLNSKSQVQSVVIELYMSELKDVSERLEYFLQNGGAMYRGPAYNLKEQVVGYIKRLEQL